MRNKQALIKELEDEKKSRTVTKDWQPNAILCKRFGLLDPFRSKNDLTYDFNKDPSASKLNKGKIEFVDSNTTSKKGGMGDEFFYKIQKTVGRNEAIQEELNKGDTSAALSKSQKDKVQALNAEYVDIESDSASDMEDIKEGNIKANMESIAAISNRPGQKVFEDIFN
jgi:hypothetical protein